MRPERPTAARSRWCTTMPSGASWSAGWPNSGLRPAAGPADEPRVAPLSRLLACALAAACLVVPATASAAPARGAPGTPGSGSLAPLTGNERPAHFHLTAAEAIRRATDSGSGRALVRREPGLRAVARAPDLGLWSVAFQRDGETRGVVEIEDRTGRTLVAGAWSWPQTGSPMDSFKQRMEWFLLLLGVLFVAGMVDWRRPLSLRTLDALAITAGFGAVVRLLRPGAAAGGHSPGRARARLPLRPHARGGPPRGPRRRALDSRSDAPAARRPGSARDGARGLQPAGGPGERCGLLRRGGRGQHPSRLAALQRRHQPHRHLRAGELPGLRARLDRVPDGAGLGAGRPGRGPRHVDCR